MFVLLAIESCISVLTNSRIILQKLLVNSLDQSTVEQGSVALLKPPTADKNRLLNIEVVYSSKVQLSLPVNI